MRSKLTAILYFLLLLLLFSAAGYLLTQSEAPGSAGVERCGEVE